MKAINQINIEKGMKVSELIRKMGKTGVLGAGRLARAVDIFNKMIKDKDCRIFLGVAGPMVPGGMKNIIIRLLDNVDVLVITGANLTHDLVEALGFRHYIGNEYADDVKLNKKGLDRIHDIYMPNEVYKKLDDFFNKNFEKLSKEKTVKDFLWQIGSLLKKDSILKTCYEKKIPIFCPALSDSAIGLMIWNNLLKNRKFNVSEFNDIKEMIDLAWGSKKNGVFYVSGGVPKNYIQQAMQFSKGASYGIQITMDRPEPGGSSGAPLREGISWGKMKGNAEFVNVICDATIALPIIAGSVS